MNRPNNITLSLIIVLCALNFVGFSQDTIVAYEPPLMVQQATRIEIESPPVVSRNRSTLPKQKNPRVAGWLSTALPGAGQVYNGQWWKVPIIYGGAGALFYFHSINSTERNLFQTEYRGRISKDTNFIPNPDLRLYSDDNLLFLRNYYQRNIELIYIFSGLLYLLNIVDAIVFAHLATFDVSENLTLRIQPFASPDLSMYALQHQRVPMQGGLRLTFTLK